MPRALIHVDDSQPGITRRRAGRGWCYFRPDGNRISEREEIDRLNAIALPPAYIDTWFCTLPHGHILATGIDAKGRRQYRYHPDFRAKNDEKKFAQCLRFGERLPRLRREVDTALGMRGLGREKIIAAVIRLLDLAAIRIGNECYTKDNRSFGATTLRQHHAAIHGKTLHFAFRAKSGKERDVEITDGLLAAIVRRLGDLPGQHLFQYIAGDERCPVTSNDVNHYIHAAMGDEFSAKDFRTWSASVCAFEILASARENTTLNSMTTEVAAFLGNTPTIARNSYIHPALIDLAKADQNAWRQMLKLPRRTKYLDRYERGLLEFLAGA